MNPDNPYQPAPRPEPQPVAPSYAVPALEQQPMQDGNAAQPVAQTTLPTPQPAPLGAAPVQTMPQPLSTPSQLSVDYLNQIAPAPKVSTNKFAVFGLIGGVLLAVIAAIVIFANAGPPDFSTQAKGVQLRIATLDTVVDGQQDHLKETAITEANSTLSSALTSMKTELTTLLKAKGIKATSSASATATRTEKAYSATLVKKLDDSYQRGTLDRTYATQMTYELTVLRSKLIRLKNTANSKSVDAFVDSSITNINTLLTTYDTFAATK